MTSYVLPTIRILFDMFIWVFSTSQVGILQMRILNGILTGIPLKKHLNSAKETYLHPLSAIFFTNPICHKKCLQFNWCSAAAEFETFLL